MSVPMPVMPGWVPVIEPGRQLHSTYALDQLTLVAKQSSRPEFVAFVMPIFGTDIPPEVYFQLQDSLIAGQIKNPDIEVFKGALAGHIAAFDQESRKILVSSSVADKVPKSRENSWLLMAALLEEFGHYIDVVLRNDLSEIAGDAKDDEGAFFAYRISHIDFANTSETEFAQYQAPKFTGPLKVKYPEFQAGINKWINKASIADDQKQGSLEFFGAGRGENFKKNPHGSFGHESIEDVLARADIGDKERRQIYFGNWLRDFSHA